MRARQAARSRDQRPLVPAARARHERDRRLSMGRITTRRPVVKITVGGERRTGAATRSRSRSPSRSASAASRSRSRCARRATTSNSPRASSSRRASSRAASSSAPRSTAAARAPAVRRRAPDRRRTRPVRCSGRRQHLQRARRRRWRRASRRPIPTSPAASTRRVRAGYAARRRSRPSRRCRPTRWPPTT